MYLLIVYLLIAIVVTLLAAVGLAWWLASLDRGSDYVGRHRQDRADGGDRS